MRCGKCGKDMSYDKKTEMTTLTNDGKEVRYLAPIYTCECGHRIITEEDLGEVCDAFDKAYKKAKVEK